jgi:hypothetical protein
MLNKLLLTLFIFYSICSYAQTAVDSIKSEDTETAYLNYDYKLQLNKYEIVDSKFLYIKAGERYNIYIAIDTLHDYVFFSATDDITKGMMIEGRLNSDTTILFKTDSTFLGTEYEASTLYYVFDNYYTANLKITMQIQGNVNPEEATYYIVARKKRQL